MALLSFNLARMGRRPSNACASVVGRTRVEGSDPRVRFPHTHERTAFGDAGKASLQRLRVQRRAYPPCILHYLRRYVEVQMVAEEQAGRDEAKVKMARGAAARQGAHVGGCGLKRMARLWRHSSMRRRHWRAFCPALPANAGFRCGCFIATAGK